ncbi:unnamed protein product [Protopolystoma xenopodis]|uniref:Uncharacterized protein n=1 Tax=Protopolystoma xenopodis TaxID=117903 RepID=A0A3S5FEA7_9PLAT|nr:unnamed protein product [Protopolystoma xenopodis]
MEASPATIAQETFQRPVTLPFCARIGPSKGRRDKCLSRPPGSVGQYGVDSPRRVARRSLRRRVSAASVGVDRTRQVPGSTAVRTGLQDFGASSTPEPVFGCIADLDPSPLSGRLSGRTVAAACPSVERRKPTTSSCRREDCSFGLSLPGGSIKAAIHFGLSSKETPKRDKSEGINLFYCLPCRGLSSVICKLYCFYMCFFPQCLQTSPISSFPISCADRITLATTSKTHKDGYSQIISKFSTPFLVKLAERAMLETVGK